MSQDSLITHGRDPAGYLQPDYQFSHNGYGLLQLSATFAFDSKDAGSSTRYFPRGSPLTIINGYALGQALMSYGWTCVKSEEIGRDGQVTYVKGFFVAIDPQKGGQITDTEATLSSAAVSEPIESHPNFSQILLPQLYPSKGTPLGGKLDAVGPPLDVNDTTRNPYRAKWLPGSIPGALNYQFVGFLPQQKENEDVNRKAGVKSYFRPSVTMKLTAYTASEELATDSVRYTGFISSKTGFGAFYIPGPYQKVAEPKLRIVSSDAALARGQNWLITAVNMEVYGGLFKVQADLLLSGPMGWDPDIYPEANFGSSAS